MQVIGIYNITVIYYFRNINPNLIIMNFEYTDLRKKKYVYIIGAREIKIWIRAITKLKKRVTLGKQANNESRTV